MVAMTTEKLLDVRDLSVAFRLGGRGVGEKPDRAAVRCGDCAEGLTSVLVGPLSADFSAAF
jgi:hypothetical protein